MFGFNKKPKENSQSGNPVKSGMDMVGNFTRHMGSATATAATGGKVADVSMFNRVINFCLMLLVVAIPLLYLPITSEVREFNKQAVLFFAVVVMLAFWVIKILTTRSVSWVKTSLDYILLGFTLVYLLASMFSIDKVSSFLGYYGRFTGSFMSVMIFVVLYFLIVNHVRTERMVNKMISLFTVSSAIAVVYGFLQLIGLYVLPFSFAKDRAFNTIGSMVALSIFTAITLVLIQWYSLARPDIKKWHKIALGAVTIIGLINLLLINAFIGWLILGLGLIVFLALGMVITNNQENLAPTWFWKPMLILVVSILFIAFSFLPNIPNPRSMISVELPVEIQLSNSTTWSMVKNALSERPILGYGPGTTGIAFGDIKPEALNKTIVWSLNFDRASSEVANIAIETGLLGLLAFEITSLLFMFYGIFFLLRKVNHPGRMQAYGLFIIWAVLYITHFFYFFNTTFYFMYFIAIAGFMAIAHWNETESETKNLTFASSPRSALSWMFVSLLLLAALLVGAFYQASIYTAETAYASGLRQLNDPKPDFGRVADSFARAVNLNPNRDVYYLAYGQNLIFRASEEAAKEEPDVAAIQTWMSDIIASGRRATELAPDKASNWSALAQFYTGVRPLVTGTDEFIIDSWKKAIERDSKNPALLVQIARAYTTASEVIDPSIAGSGADTDQDGLADSKEQELGSNAQSSDTNGNGVSDGDEVKAGFNPSGTGRLTAAQVQSFTRVDQAMLKEAENALKKAIELKPDLPDSYIELARVMERSNKLADARKQLDDAAKLFPGNPDIRFEQGRITFNQKNYNDAEVIFKDVIKLQPNHANAHYSLGLVYQQKGDKANALREFEKVREITGPNVDLEKLINDLKG